MKTPSVMQHASLTPGTKVRFASPLNCKEELAVMTVVEDRVERVLVTDDADAGMPLPPQSVYWRRDLVEMVPTVTYRFALRPGVPLGRLNAREWTDVYYGTDAEIESQIDEDLHRYGVRREDVIVMHPAR